MPESVTPEFMALQQALAGRYSLERELGRGGMGVVFLARDVALDRLVAIKLLPPALAERPGLRERFLREAQTAAKLSHPNIVPIHAVEEVRGLVFFVMAFVDGETLGERLRGKGPLTPHEAATMLQETAWALGYAHGRSVVHRDVKPDNIMLERGTGRAVVMDFGIAGAANDQAEAFGTAQYVSPEQANGDPVDGRSDLYSLGVVAFVALTGRLPFEAEDAHGLLAMHITKPAPTVLSLSPGLPRKLAQAVDRCLAKRPEERFPDGESLAESVGQSVERQRELPVAVRVWMTRNAQPTIAHLIWVPFVSGPSLGFGIGLMYMGRPLTIVAGVGLILAGFISPIGITAVYRFVEARRLLGAGYALEDIRLAVRMHAQRRREELAVEFDHDPPLLARVARWITIGSGWTAIGALVTLFALRGRESVLPFFGVSALIASAGAILQTFIPGARLVTDRRADLRVRFWNSTFGKWFEKLARINLKRRTVPAELTYRPTEMAIGLAADALFESLAKDQRKELHDLPAVLERLQRDAALMRKTVDELNGALAGLGDQGDAARSSALAGAAASAAGVALESTRAKLRGDLATDRDQAALRLADAVTALENIRLSLLRLKAGTGTVSDLTADLTAARSLTDDLTQARALNDAMRFTAEGRAEADALLKAPRSSKPLLKPADGLPGA